MQILSLMKKDFLLIRKSIPLMIFVLFFAISNMSNSTPGTIIYSSLVAVLTIMIYNLISMEEIKLKGHIYLATTPMSKKSIGLAKFFIIIITFFIITISYMGLSTLETKLINLGSISLLDTVMAFFLIVTFFSIYIPLTLKLGFVKLQTVSFLMIFIIPIIMPFILGYTDGFVKVKNYITNFSLPILILASIAFLIMITMIIGAASSNILNRKEY